MISTQGRAAEPRTSGSAAPVSIDHAVERRKALLFVDWSLNNHCNYRCSYCPPHLHNGGIKGPGFELVARLIDQISSRSPKPWKHFQFTGGEPTAYKHIGRTLELVKSRGNTTGLISNASRPLSWWAEHRALIDEVTLTFHVEMADREHFLRVIDLIRPVVNTHINVTMLPDRFDECAGFADLLAVQFPDVSISLKPLLVGFKTQLYPYSPEQLHHLQTYGWPNRRPRTDERAKGHMLVTFEGGRRAKLGASRLVALGLNSFTGWSCDIGLELICIYASGEIFRGICREGGQLGTVAGGLEAIPDAPVTCSRATCKCLADISVSKRTVSADAGDRLHR